MTAAGMWGNALWPDGSNAQSVAFFSPPGIDRLYSRVTHQRRVRNGDGLLERVRLGRVARVDVQALQREVSDGISVNSRPSGAGASSAFASSRLIHVEDKLPMK